MTTDSDHCVLCDLLGELAHRLDLLAGEDPWLMDSDDDQTIRTDIADIGSHTPNEYLGIDLLLREFGGEAT